MEDNFLYIQDAIAGLKEARGELEEGLGQGHISSQQAPEGIFASQVARYGAKIANEKMRLLRIRGDLQEKQDRVNERLERIKQLEEAIEKTRKDIEIINSEISLFTNTDDDASVEEYDERDRTS